MASITRATGKLALCGRRLQATNTSGPLSALLQFQPTSLLASAQTRRMATESALETYKKQKQAAKDLRTQKFNDGTAHKEKVKRRRAGRPKNTRKKLFRQFYVPKMEHDVYHDRQARKLKLDWKLQVAVVLERLPQVLPDKPKWQADWDVLEAYLAQFGRVYPEQLTGKMEILEMDELTDEALLANMPKGLKLAPRETEADLNGDVRTLNRRLKTWVYLTVKETVDTLEGEKELWRLPTADVQGKETLLETAKRAIREKVGNSMDIWYPSNMPMTVDMRAFSEEERAQNDNAYGVKTFFMVVQYDQGEVTMDDCFADDFAWFDKKELVERIEEQHGEEKGKLYFYLLNDIWRYHFDADN